MAKLYTIGDLLSVLRDKAFDRGDEGLKVILAPECEKFTHVIFNVNSGILDRLENLIVEKVDADDDCVRLWLRTGRFDEPIGLYDTRLETRVELAKDGADNG